jgi:hypothetical protein
LSNEDKEQTMNSIDRQKFKEHLAKQKADLLDKINKENSIVRTGRDKSRLPTLTNELKVLEALERQLLKLEGKK